MIAQLVFDLPLEGPFDYLIPSHLESQMKIGMRVQAFLATRKVIGIVIGLLKVSEFENLKPIKAIDPKFCLDSDQMLLGKNLSRYYGCSLGEALFTIARGSVHGSSPKALVGDLEIVDARQKLSGMTNNGSDLTLYETPSGEYSKVITSLIKPLALKKERVLILVPDQFIASAIERELQSQFSSKDYVIGLRSLVFRSLSDISLVIVLDEENSSFKQEQTPMYDVRDVLLMRAEAEEIHIAFVSATPSVELIALVEKGKIQKKEIKASLPKVQAVDLNNYKFTPKGLISIPIKNAIEQNLKNKEKTILVLNRKGNYAVTRCADCGLVLKCGRCDAPLSYSRSHAQYSCAHCNFKLAQETNCPVCRKPSWKSVGIGIEQLQKELKSFFPQAKVLSFERSKEQALMDFDVLIATQAVLRFRFELKVHTVAIIDIDHQLNRLQFRSSFNAWSMVVHLRSMAREQVFMQTRNPSHYVLESLIGNKPQLFYQEDMSIRKELKLPPFGHEISVTLRSRTKESARVMAEELYAQIKGPQVHSPIADTLSKKRDQYRFVIVVKGDKVMDMVALIKTGLAQIKRKSKVIVTFNVD